MWFAEEGGVGGRGAGGAVRYFDDSIYNGQCNYPANLRLFRATGETIKT